MLWFSVTHFESLQSTERTLFTPFFIPECEVISGFGRHLGLCETLSFDALCCYPSDARQDEFMGAKFAMSIEGGRVYGA